MAGEYCTRRGCGDCGRCDADPERYEPARPCICTVCDFAGIFEHAVGHYRLTGHALSYRGTVQDFSKHAVTAEELEARR